MWLGQLDWCGVTVFVMGYVGTCERMVETRSPCNDGSLCEKKKGIVSFNQQKKQEKTHISTFSG